ncbi:MAG TPA: ABC transporter permease [Puia sp.]|jgi:predicted permease|nr:ABC transporter permease [Puia sp.]
MFRNNLKIARRSLLKDRQSSVLNLIGLSTGLACTLLIYLWVSDEWQIDRFFKKDSQLFQLMEARKGDGISVSVESSGILAETVARDMPQVQYAAAVAPSGWFPKFSLTVGDNTIKASGQYAGKDYFNIFSYQLLDGTKDLALADKSSIVISEDLARTLFNRTDGLIGKTIQLEHDKQFHISGVFKDLPDQSSEKFDFVLSFGYMKEVHPWVKEWSNKGPHNYVLLKEGANVDAFNRQVADIITRYAGDSAARVFAYRYSDNYLYGKFVNGKPAGGRIEYVRLFSIIAIFILVIACINFMNLSTARASKRLKEVGIKKVVGASRRQLIYQFISESMLLSFFSLVLAVILVILILPAFNQLTDKHIVLHPDKELILAAVAITLITGVLAGSYPAFYLSAFRPVLVLKGKLNTSLGELFVRKGLVVFQFTLSMIFIVAVLVVFRQMKYVQSERLGYNKDNVLVFNSDGRLLGNQENFVAELKRLPGVVSATGANHNLVGHTFATGGMQWEGMATDQKPMFEVASVGHDFCQTMEIRLMAGKDFSDFKGGSSIILNQAAIDAMGIKDPIGKTVRFLNQPRRIVGIIQNFHFESFHEIIRPMVLLPDASDSGSNYKILARIQAGRETEALARIRRLYEEWNKGYVFDYRWLDAAFQRQYRSEKNVADLSKYFAGLAILISCLGLFGLAAFTAQRRQKEIGIRKVVGASTRQIAVMLSMGFLKLIGVALLVALPLAWWIMNEWLHSFAYRVGLGPGIFLIASAAVILITVCTISMQSIRAAVANPVKSLKAE